MKLPILFIIFNRPDTTQVVFEVIKEYKPTSLYIAADGPRESKKGEKELCLETREIIKKIDWDCEVKTLFRENNLGCGKSVSGAINWFFDNVEEGIILEDDCVPDLSFFEYCKNLLELYRHNEKIFMISGSNFLPINLRPKESYYFSKLPHIWGWATWKRAWNKYDFKMNDFENFKKNKIIEQVWPNQTNTQNYFLERFQEIIDGSLDTWDYQLNFAIWNNSGYTITPSVNLVSNIGFGNGATHTFNKKDSLSNIPTEAVPFPLKLHSEKIYGVGDNHENSLLYKRDTLIKKILKKMGLFNVVKKVYLKLIK